MRCLLITLLALTLTLAFASGTAAPAVAAEAPCADDLFLPRKIECYSDEALRQGDPHICLGTEKAVEFNCLSLYAERTGDISACVHISGSGEETETLRNACIAGTAVATADPALCDRVEVEALKDTCYVQLVLERGADEGLCGRVRNSLLREACRAP
jgi:hypothetical protein